MTLFRNLPNHTQFYNQHGTLCIKIGVKVWHGFGLANCGAASVTFPPTVEVTAVQKCNECGTPAEFTELQEIFCPKCIQAF
jgi:hypothetical protein